MWEKGEKPGSRRTRTRRRLLVLLLCLLHAGIVLLRIVVGLRVGSVLSGSTRASEWESLQCRYSRVSTFNQC